MYAFKFSHPQHGDYYFGFIGETRDDDGNVLDPRDVLQQRARERYRAHVKEAKEHPERVVASRAEAEARGLAGSQYLVVINPDEAELTVQEARNG